MRVLILLFLLSILSCTSIYAVERKSWLDVDYKQVMTIREVPVRVLTSLLLKMPNDRRMADRNAKYNSSDLADSKLSHRRFILAGISSKFVLIAYDHGGRSFHQSLAVFSIETKRPRLIFVTRSPYSLHNIREIKILVKKGSLRNEINNPLHEW